MSQSKCSLIKNINNNNQKKDISYLIQSSQLVKLNFPKNVTSLNARGIYTDQKITLWNKKSKSGSLMMLNKLVYYSSAIVFILALCKNFHQINSEISNGSNISELGSY
ncbi:hypothetical protein BpHYR1_000441 [Brachionus plicatilis]|uniref:Uncharacterized protein n=1 Tax=Brachionus plicatilis TaxID=10195 RepID=A0A3M7PLY1_BRAPC|nr:hypothetical protein BpHYR1_000441 [Brachionus plicatilis]